METIKITNPEYLGLLAEPIQKFVEKVKIPGIRYETLFTYFVESIRNGMVQKQIQGVELEEFWVVMDEEKPIAFGHWFKRTVPYTATVEVDYVCAWGNKAGATAMLVDRATEFAAKHRSPQIVGNAVNTIVFNHLVSVSKKKGYKVINTESINWAARKE